MTALAYNKFADRRGDSIQAPGGIFINTRSAV
jgi:hypothetical protein